MGFLGRSVKSIKVQCLGRGWATAGTRCGLALTVTKQCLKSLAVVLGGLSVSWVPGPSPVEWLLFCR